LDLLQKILEEISSKNDELSQILGLKEEVFLSYFFEISQVQDPFRFRSRWYADRLSRLLIDEEGRLDQKRLKEILLLLQKKSYPLVPGRENDALLFAHFRKTLKLLLQSSFVAELEKFRLPLCHKKAEEFISDTVQKKQISNTELRIAVLSAWLTPLRQNVGSCFATAPAILIQEEMPERFLRDLQDLLHTGRISRVIEGKEYIIPLSPSWGMGDLLKPFSFFDSSRLSFSPGVIFALMEIGEILETDSWEKRQRKCYEILENIQADKPENIRQFLRFTLLRKMGLEENDLSFEKSRTKMMVLSDNVHPFAYQVSSLSAKEKRVQEFEEVWARVLSRFRTLVDHPLLKAWEFSLASLSDVKLGFTRWNLYVSLGLDPKEEGGLGSFLYQLVERKLDEANQEVAELQYEYERAVNFVQTTENLMQRDPHSPSLQAELQRGLQEMQFALQRRDGAHKKAVLFSQLFSSLLEHYYELFQEYFQELYDPEIQEVKIQNYNDSPAGFRLVYKHGRRDPSTWTSIFDEEGYSTSLRDFFHETEGRIKVLFPLELGKELAELITEITLFVQSRPFLEGATKRMRLSGEEGQEARKPWSYPSGGTMDNLVKIYFKRDVPLHALTAKIESEVHLFQFYFEALHLCEENSPNSKLFLSLSPTHAFLFMPDLLEMSLRKKPPLQILQEAQSFFSEIVLDESCQRCLLDEITHLLPTREGAFRAIFPRNYQTLTVAEFRVELVHALKSAYRNNLAQKNADWEKLVDSFLYSALPLQKRENALQNCKVIFEKMKIAISQKTENKLGELFEREIVTARQFRELALAALLWATGSIFSEQNLSFLFLQKAREMRLCYPQPLLFADTNWPGSYFGWVISPYSLSVELWALDRMGSQGFPMTDWRCWLDNSRVSDWVLYYKTSEYS
jgi:hypothetical protein